MPICPIHKIELQPTQVERAELIYVCVNATCNYSQEDVNYEITSDEAKALLKLLSHEYIPHDPHEQYETLMRLINGLTNFVDTHENNR